MLKQALMIFFLFLLSAQPLRGQAFYTESGKVEFRSSVPLHSFTGTSDRLTGKIDLESGIVDFYVDLATLDTGIRKRDKDMRKTLETDEYPFAEFYGTLDSDFDPDSTGPQAATVKGEFGLHGIRREVTVEGTLQMTDEGLQVKAAWIVNLKDYDIKPPGILFYRVDEEQDVKIEALLTPTQDQ